MHKKVVIFGNGGVAKMIHSHLTHDSSFAIAAFTVDATHLKDETLLGLPVVAFDDVERIFPPDDFQLFIPIGFRSVNQLRADKYREAKAKGYGLINYASSKAMIAPGVTLGDNCVIMDGAIIGPSVSIGNDVFIGPGTVISHGDVIGDHCFVAAGAVVLGDVRIEPYCVLGANSTIKDGIIIASECVIGAGVTITRTTSPREVYIGPQVEPSAKRSDELRQWLTWPA